MQVLTDVRRGAQCPAMTRATELHDGADRRRGHQARRRVHRSRRAGAAAASRWSRSSGELDIAATAAVRARVDDAAGRRALVLDLARDASSTPRCSRSCCGPRAELDAPRDAGSCSPAFRPAVRRLLDLTRHVRAVHDRARPRRGGARRGLSGWAGARRPAADAGRSASRCWVARGRTASVKPACSKSLPAEAASTVVTVRPVAGACRRRATSASALHAPVQRVHVSSSPTA